MHLTLGGSAIFTLLATQGGECCGQCITPSAMLKPLAFQGDPAAGLGEYIHQDFYGGTSVGPYVFFSSGLSGPTGNEYALWRADASGATTLFARSGIPVPPLPQAVVIDKLSKSFEWVTSANGVDAYLLARLVGPGITPANQWAILRASPSGVALSVQTDTQAPGYFPGVVFANLGSPHVAHDGTGDIIFGAVLKGPGIYPDTQASIWRLSNAGLSVLVQAGEPAPGKRGPWYGFEYLRTSLTGRVFLQGSIRPDPFPGPVTDRGWWFKDDGPAEYHLGLNSPLPELSPGATLDFVMATVALGENDATAWAIIAKGPALTPDNNRFAIVHSEGTTKKLMRSGDVAPGLDPTTLVLSFSQHVIRRADSGVVFATLTGPNVTYKNDSAAWIWSASGQELLWRSGDAVPGFPGWTFWPALPNSGFPACYLNGAGDVLLEVVASDSAGLQRTGVMTRYGGSTLQPLVISGQLLELSPGDTREVAYATMLPESPARSAGIDGQPVVLSEAGVTTLRVAFTDGAMGIYHATLSTPECVADFDKNNQLSIDDFVAFQTSFAVGMPIADIDCDGQLTISDFIEFQSLFAIGCP